MKKKIIKSLGRGEQKPADGIELIEFNESTDIDLYSEILKVKAFAAKKLPTLPDLDIKIYSPDWINYRNQMLKVSDLHKQLLCLIFLSKLIACLQHKILILSVSEHAEQFHHISLLFWYAINNTNIAFTDIGVLLQRIQGNDFNKSSSLQKQNFFLINAIRLITRYRTLLSSLDNQKNKTIKPETLLLNTISSLYTASFEAEAFMLAVKNVITDFEIEITALKYEDKSDTIIPKKDAEAILKIHEEFSKGIANCKVLRANVKNILDTVYGSRYIYRNTLASRIDAIITRPMFTPEALSRENKDTNKLPRFAISELEIPVETKHDALQKTEDKETVTLIDSKDKSSEEYITITLEDEDVFVDTLVQSNNIEIPIFLKSIAFRPLQVLFGKIDTHGLQSLQKDIIKYRCVVLVFYNFFKSIVKLFKRGKLDLNKTKYAERFQQIMLLFALTIENTPYAETISDQSLKFLQYNSFLKKPAEIQRKYVLKETANNILNPLYDDYYPQDYNRYPGLIKPVF